MTDTPTLAGLAAELEDALARIARLESMTTHPAWCVPLTEDEEGADTAESGPVRPCEPRKGGDAPTDPRPPRGPQNGAQAEFDPIEAAHRAAKAAGMVAVKIPLDWTATKWRSKADDGIAWSRWLYDVGHAIAEGIEAQQALNERNEHDRD